jgi:hypothetical protein
MTRERDDPSKLDIHRGIGLMAVGRVALPGPPIIRRRLCQQHFKPT